MRLCAPDSEMIDATHATHDDDIRFGEADIARRKAYVELEPEDVSRLIALEPLVSARARQYVSGFFDHLARFEEAAPLFARLAVLEQARRLKREHLEAMVQGHYGREYVDQRLRLAKLYSEVGLHVRMFLGAYHHLLSAIGLDIVAHFAGDRAEGFRHFTSLRRIGYFDMALIIDFMLAERESTIARQQESIRELSAPVLQLRKGLLLLPIIGAVDTRRAQLLTENVLVAVRSSRARVVVVDVTGVSAVNREVANHLVKTVEAARLIGVTAILSGLSPSVARTLLDLGVDLSGFDIVGDLRSGVERSEHLLGYRVMRESATA